MSGSSVMKLELEIRCENLKNRDFGRNKSDPFVVVYRIQHGGGPKMQLVGQTEQISDNLNPHFARRVPVDYAFQEHTMLFFQVLDKDTRKTDLLGEVAVSLGSIVSRNGHSSKLDKGGKGQIQIIPHEVGGRHWEVEFLAEGRNLDKKDLLGKSDPYFIFYLQQASGGFTPVYRSEIISKTLNPSWNFATVKLPQEVANPASCRCKFEVFDHDNGSPDDLIGETSVLAVSELAGRSLDLIEPKKKAKKRSYVNSGVFSFKTFEVNQYPSFIEYMTGSLYLNFMVAVDFTQSNGDPRDSRSLHYFDRSSGVPNQYLQALRSVGTILNDYSKDQLYAGFGYGGRMPDGSISHDFALNGNPSDPRCQGIAGLEHFYLQALQNVKLSGPTNFSPVIRHAMSVTRSFGPPSQACQVYNVLLILTDGAITDMDQTTQAIVEASRDLPLSIIIVGVGNADFRAMNILDADDKALRTSTGEVASADIVQFVAFRDQQSATQLASNVLAELPSRVVRFFVRRRILPQPSPYAAFPASSSNLAPHHSFAPPVPSMDPTRISPQSEYTMPSFQQQYPSPADYPARFSSHADLPGQVPSQADYPSRLPSQAAYPGQVPSQEPHSSSAYPGLGPPTVGCPAQSYPNQGGFPAPGYSNQEQRPSGYPAPRYPDQALPPTGAYQVPDHRYPADQPGSSHQPQGYQNQVPQQPGYPGSSYPAQGAPHPGGQYPNQGPPPPPTGGSI